MVGNRQGATAKKDAKTAYPSMGPRHSTDAAAGARTLCDQNQPRGLGPTTRKGPKSTYPNMTNAAREGLTLGATCGCTAAPLLCGGPLLCSACRAPVVVVGVAHAPSDEHHTEPDGWPPGCKSRRAARERIRAVPGHTRVGNGRATIWRVARTAYEAHHARQQVAVTAPSPLPAEEDIAARAIAASGLRPTRGAPVTREDKRPAR
jgi:hypothetical protein